MIRTITCTALCCLSIAAMALETELTVQVDAVFDDLTGGAKPGCAVGVIRDGELIYSQGYGLASLENGVPISDRTVFYSGSVSKQFAAAAVAMAAREGHLGLDDDIGVWFPELPDYGATITVRHLIHHTSGLRDYLTLMALAGVPFETPVSADWVLGLIARQRSLNFEPGAEYLYSNSGYFLLAQLVGRATGRSLSEYTQEKFFQPLGMTDSRFHDDRELVVERRAAAYAVTEDGTFTINWSPSFDQVGSGGLLTTIQDLLAWDRSYYDGRLGEGFWDALLVRGMTNDGEVLDYAFGLTVDEYRGHRRIQHGGAMFGYRAFLARFPDDAVSVAVLCNVEDANPGARSDKLADLLLKGLDPVEPDSSEAEQVEEEETAAASALEREAWIGRYRSMELDAVAQIQRDGDGLTFQVGFSEPRPLEVFEGDRIALPPFVEATGELNDNRMDAFVIEAGRVRGIRFERLVEEKAQ